MNANLISIIIPVKNGSNFLQEALDHIKVQQMNVEIIVIDDGGSVSLSVSGVLPQKLSTKYHKFY